VRLSKAKGRLVTQTYAAEAGEESSATEPAGPTEQGKDKKGKK
jgi:hypothetical protein